MLSFKKRTSLHFPQIKVFARKYSQQEITSSLDLKNIALLQKESRGWWDPFGRLMPLHAMNQVRVPYIRNGLVATGAVKDIGKRNRGTLRGLYVLEVGCGGGILTEALARLEANVTAIDPAEELINMGKEHLKGNLSLWKRIKYLTDTVETHVVKNREKYDVVIVSEVIEHVNDQVNFLKHCIDSVKPGGSIFLSTMNKTLLCYFLGIFVAENILKIVPKGTHEYEKFISPTDTQAIFEKNKCSVVSLDGLLYSPWDNTWNFTKLTDVNYIQHAIKH